MEYKILGKKNDIALIITDEIVINDTQSALDLIASVQYETDCDKLIVYKSCVTDDFFVLSTGIAGEILQRFINYRKKICHCRRLFKMQSIFLYDLAGAER